MQGGCSFEFALAGLKLGRFPERAIILLTSMEPDSDFQTARLKPKNFSATLLLKCLADYTLALSGRLSQSQLGYTSAVTLQAVRDARSRGPGHSGRSIDYG